MGLQQQVSRYLHIFCAEVELGDLRWLVGGLGLGVDFLQGNNLDRERSG